MMGVTHALMGMLMGASSLFLTPEFFFYAAIAGFIGGLFPDIDLALYHRKSLHFPIGYSVVTAVTAGFILYNPGTYTVTAFYFFLSAAIHSWIDIFGGGLEHRPWEGTSNKGVYSHSLGKWFPPRQWIRYDGAPEDFALAALLAIPLLYLFTGVVRDLVVACIVTGLLYSLSRKKLVDLQDRLL